MGFDNTLMQDDQLEDTLYKNADAANMLLDEALEKENETLEENQLEKPMDIDFDAGGIPPPRNDDDDYDDFGMYIQLCDMKFSQLLSFYATLYV